MTPPLPLQPQLGEHKARFLAFYYQSAKTVRLRYDYRRSCRSPVKSNIASNSDGRISLGRHPHKVCPLHIPDVIVVSSPIGNFYQSAPQPSQTRTLAVCNPRGDRAILIKEHIGVHLRIRCGLSLPTNSNRSLLGGPGIPTSSD